jgi:hypothetical protein
MKNPEPKRFRGRSLSAAIHALSQLPLAQNSPAYLRVERELAPGARLVSGFGASGVSSS